MSHGGLHFFDVLIGGAVTASSGVRSAGRFAEPHLNPGLNPATTSEQ
jgi:hypothetical protein